MGPKKGKKAAGKEKKGKVCTSASAQTLMTRIPIESDGGENGGALTPEEQAKMLFSANQSLQMQLADRQDQATKAFAAKRELQIRVGDLQKDFEEERNTTLEITRDMTRQYKGMQEELLNRVNGLENTITEMKDQLELARIHLENTKRDKDLVIAAKDTEIQDLKTKMDEMAQEFGDMLKQTLGKMRERIEVSNAGFDKDAGVPIIRKLDDFNLGAGGSSETTNASNNNNNNTVVIT